MRMRAKQFGLIVAYLLVCATAMSRVVDVIFDPPRKAYLRTVDYTRKPPKVLSNVPLPLEESKQPWADRLIEWVFPLPGEVGIAVTWGNPTILFRPGDVLKERWSDRTDFASGPSDGMWEQVWRVDRSNFAWRLRLTAACSATALIAATFVLRILLRGINRTRGFEVKNVVETVGGTGRS
jgi:hypothetical protein